MGSLGDAHAYGYALGCISRRRFVYYFAILMTVIKATTLLKWFLGWRLFDQMLGVPYPPTEGCKGYACYQIFTCQGMAETTQHIREPLFTLTGIILYPMGVIGAHHGYRSYLQALAVYLVLIAIGHFGISIADVTYTNTCGAYPLNMINEALLWPFPFPPGVRAAAQDKLKDMSAFPAYFPKETVAKITETNIFPEGFPVLQWYIVVACFLVLFFAYAAYETVECGILAERGPIGLGMHFGLGQFNEFIDFNVVRRKKEKPSQFVTDAQLTPWSDPEQPLGYHVGKGNYGAFEGVAARLADAARRGTGLHRDNFAARKEMVEKMREEANEELAKSLEELEEVRKDIKKEKEEGIKEEKEAIDEFRKEEIDEEEDEMYEAEDRALEDMEEAKAKAEEMGKSSEEAEFIANKAYAAAMKREQLRMMQQVHARLVHEHYRIAELHKEAADKDFEGMEREALEEVKRARMKVQNAEAAAREFERQASYAQAMPSYPQATQRPLVAFEPQGGADEEAPQEEPEAGEEPKEAEGVEAEEAEAPEAAASPPTAAAQPPTYSQSSGSMGSWEIPGGNSPSQYYIGSQFYIGSPAGSGYPAAYPSSTYQSTNAVPLGSVAEAAPPPAPAPYSNAPFSGSYVQSPF